VGASGYSSGMPTLNENIDAMLAAHTYAVVGASNHPEKYGHIAYQMLKEYGKTVWPVNPRAAADGETLDGAAFYATVADLPEVPEVAVVVVPPPVTEQIVEDLGQAGIRNVWMQPGAESPAAVVRAEELGIAAVHSGPCILVGLRTHGKR
jgi:Predicted CoA-binding protein